MHNQRPNNERRREAPAGCQLQLPGQAKNDAGAQECLSDSNDDPEEMWADVDEHTSDVAHPIIIIYQP